MYGRHATNINISCEFKLLNSTNQDLNLHMIGGLTLKFQTHRQRNKTRMSQNKQQYITTWNMEKYHSKEINLHKNKSWQ